MGYLNRYTWWLQDCRYMDSWEYMHVMGICNLKFYLCIETVAYKMERESFQLCDYPANVLARKTLKML